VTVCHQPVTMNMRRSGEKKTVRKRCVLLTRSIHFMRIGHE
jgi:hypothetical protein